MLRRLRAPTQRLVLHLISVLAELYVKLNEHPIRLQVITEEHRPAGPQLPFKATNQVEWLNELYNNSP